MTEFKYIIGVDLGGTAIKFGFFDLSGELIKKWSIPTNIENNGEKIIRDISASIDYNISKLNIDKNEIKGIGIAVPGPVDSDGIILNCVNLGWKNKDIQSELKEVSGFDVYVINDANSAALGELWKGSGSGSKNIIFVTLGTGVGGGIIIDGKIIPGKHGLGGEIGHFCVDNTDNAVLCNCGNKGCLEKYSSATAIINNAKIFLGDEYKIENAKDVFDLAQSENKKAEKAIDIAADKLGFAFANLSVILDPQVFIIGGGVSNAGDYLINKIKSAYDKYNRFCKSDSIIISVSKLGNDAGIYGSAKLVLDN